MRADRVGGGSKRVNREMLHSGDQKWTAEPRSRILPSPVLCWSQTVPSFNVSPDPRGESGSNKVGHAGMQNRMQLSAQ